MSRVLLVAGLLVWATLVVLLLATPEPFPGHVVSVDADGRVTN